MKLLPKILNSRSEENGNFFIEVKKMIGFAPKNLQIYKKAFTHRSTNEKDACGNPINFERMEFLGDTMLGTIISVHLYKEVPSGDEGYLTKMRSKIVSREHLNELGKDLGLIRFLQSKIPVSSFGDNVHGNMFEALIGAIYLDKGFKFCERFIQKKVIEPYVDIHKLEGKVISYKSLLIEWCQKEKKTFDFNTFEDESNEPVKHFKVILKIDSKIIAKARGTSKKKAEEAASKRAFFALQNKIEQD